MAVKDGVKGEFEILEEQLAKAAKEARGKKFVLDRYGQTVVVGKVDPNNLPAFNTTLLTSIKSEDDSKIGRAVHSSHDHEHAQGKKRFVRVAGSRGVDESSFQPNLSLASTLTGVESIPKLNPGVTVRSKVGERSGDPIPEDQRRISKKTYLSKSTSIQPALAQLDDYETTFSNARSTQGNGTRGKTQKNLRFDSSTIKNIESLPDIDPLEGSRKINLEKQQYDLSDDDLGLGPYSSKGNAPDVVLPKKANTKNKRAVELLTKSPDGGKPRDRDLVPNMKPAVDRKHLAAPPPGFISGHGNVGMVDQGNKGLNSSSILSGSLESNSYSSEWFQRRKI